MKTKLSILCIGITIPFWLMAEEISPDALELGYWVSARGGAISDSEFLAERIEVIDEQRFEEIIGTAAAASRSDADFSVLGIGVVVDENTRLDAGVPLEWAGNRYRIEGMLEDEVFIGREIGLRGDGRDRLVGRITEIDRASNGTRVNVLGYWVSLASGISVEIEKPLNEYLVSTSRFTSPESSVDEDDLFGDGFRLSDDLRLQTQIELRSLDEENFDLDNLDPEDRTDRQASFRARLNYTPRNNFYATAEVKARRLWRDDENDGSLSSDEVRLGETFVRWSDIGSSPIDVIVGRQDFDDTREWIYDQDLDGVRAIVSGERITAELSASTTLSHGTLFDESATNLIAYLSNNDEIRHIAGYAIYRDIDLGPLEETPLHIGARVIGEFGDHSEGWIDVATLRGKRAGQSLDAWGLDLGITREFGRASNVNVTAAFAHGTGDDSPGGSDTQFRQTGLQDNNAKFGGVTSFRYYGELVDPELSNMSIATFGVGFEPARRTSIDLVWHWYRQAELTTERFESEIDQNPNGRERDLGWELDVIVGIRRSRSWDLEFVAAYFEPGPAFQNRDEALLAKLQFRHRR